MPTSESETRPTTDDPVLLDDTARLDEAGRERSRDLSRRTAEPPPGVVPGYRILEKLGEGAYGSVWLARQQNTGKQVAVKFYSHRRGVDWALLNREVEKLAALDAARGVVALVEVGWDRDPPFYVMEYLEDGSLGRRLENGPLEIDAAVRLAESVLGSLSAAHGAGILHCDLKPANVLIGPEGEPRLCDFGQSRLLQESRPSFGTLFYMAPEQAAGQGVPDVRWDVYALGAILFQMLVGHPPHRSPANEARLAACESTEERLKVYAELVDVAGTPTEHARRPGVDRRLAEIVARCLDPEPETRFANCQAVADAFRRRAREKSKAPMRLLALLGPALLLLAMSPFVAIAWQRAVGTARENITARALESDALSASILSRSLERDLQDRIADLQRHARYEDLRRAIVEADADDWADRTDVQHLLDEYKARVDERREEQGRSPDTSWFLTDSEGIQRWRSPASKATDLHSYVWRDYFHGLGHELPKETRTGSLDPIDEPYVSSAFRSEATLRFMVAGSVPVRDDEGNVVAVLARTAHLDGLLADYQFPEASTSAEVSPSNGQVHRVVAVVDRRDWKFLNHEWMTTPGFRDLSPRAREQLTLPEPYRARIESLEPGEIVLLEDFVDRFAEYEPDEYGGRWLAAFVPIGETGWVAVIQERSRHALEPVESLRSELVAYGITAVVVAAGLTGLLWFFVSVSLTERPRQT